MKYQIVRLSATLAIAQCIEIIVVTDTFLSLISFQFIPILLIQMLNLFWYFLILRIMIRSVSRRPPSCFDLTQRD